MSYTVKVLTEREIAEIYNTYMKQDFPPNELKPLSHILRSMEKGYGFCLGLHEKAGLAGYAVSFCVRRQGARFLITLPS